MISLRRARARYFGVASRAELLLHRSGPRHDDYDVEVTGYPAGWSVAAARAAFTAGTPCPCLSSTTTILPCVSMPPMLSPPQPIPALRPEPRSLPVR